MTSPMLDGLTNADRVALMEQAFSSVDEVCSLLEPHEWDLPTDLPGWSVKDNLSHLAHYESTAVGRPQRADVDISAYADRLHDDFARANEIGVEARRGMPGSEVLSEYRDVTVERVKHLHAIGDDDWERTITVPIGTMPQSQIIGIRTLDVYYHEQDIRRATGRPGHLHGDVARFIFEWMGTRALPRVVAKSAQAPDGSTVVFDVDAPGRTLAIATRDGKGFLDGDPVAAILTMRMDCETFLCLVGGRLTPQRARDEGRLAVEGDESLAARILEHIVVVP